MLLAVCSLTCRKVDAVVEDPEDQRAWAYLRDYLRIDTSNPPGGETAGARYLQRVLTEAGVESQLVGSDPNRMSLYSRLRSGKSAPALLLLHHIDVVPADPREWSVKPFSGTMTGGYIWGRGALDIKSLGIAELMAFVDLHKPGTQLTRDVIYLAVADEESGGGKGCGELLTSRADLFENVGYVINEGGANETIVDRVSFWGIEVSQKIPLWLRLEVKGEGGHGSLPPDDGGSAGRLIELLSRIRTLELPYRLSPPVARQFSSLSQVKRGIKQEIMRNPERFFRSPRFESEFPASYRSLLRDTLVVTELKAGNGVNSVPSFASASIDIRLLPDASPDEMLQRIRELVGNAATIEVLLKGEPARESPVDSDLYRVLVARMKKAEPSSVAGPSVSPGTTDSRFFRQRGIVAYGVSPFKVNYYDAAGVHGVDERIRARFYSEGVRLMRDIVREFSTTRPQ